MSLTRVYIGHLSNHTTERDVEHFFRGYGRIRDIVLKRGFGFIEFEDTRDAEDAVDELNGKYLCSNRVIVEFSRARGSNRGRYRPRDYDRYGDRERCSRYGGGSQRNNRYSPPVQTRHRLIVDNLSTRISWQDLKDMLRRAGCAVTYADAHRIQNNEAVVCFASRLDLSLAMEKFDDKEINGRRLKLTDATTSCSRSRSRSGRSSRSSSARRSSSHGGSWEKMTDSETENDSVMKAVGFKMDNLKSFPFSRLPRDFQVEVIEEMHHNQKIKLFNVNAGFRRYFARNGIFGEHVDEIKIFLILERVMGTDGYIHIQKGVSIAIQEGCPYLDYRGFGFHKERALFRYISSCTRLMFEDDYETDDDDEWVSRGGPAHARRLTKRQQEKLIKANAEVEIIGKWFPNLRFVEQLTVDGQKRIYMNLQMLESFRLKVTEYAEFPALRSSAWENLTNQLSICKNVYFTHGDPRGFPGMEIENDPKKKNDILDTFKKFETRSRWLSDLFRRRDCLNPFATPFSINCYRAKIDENKEMIVVVG